MRNEEERERILCAHAYRNGGRDASRWALMRRMTLTRPDGSLYLGRLRVVQTPWFAVHLHRLDTPDPGADLHDHPWPFVSVILRGGYDEEVADVDEASTFARVAERYATARRGIPRRWRAGTVHHMGLTQAHRIRRLRRSPTWTLVLCGRRRRSWGFYTPGGFVDHDLYDHSAIRRLEEVS